MPPRGSRRRGKRRFEARRKIAGSDPWSTAVCIDVAVVLFHPGKIAGSDPWSTAGETPNRRAPDGRGEASDYRCCDARCRSSGCTARVQVSGTDAGLKQTASSHAW